METKLIRSKNSIVGSTFIFGSTQGARSKEGKEDRFQIPSPGLEMLQHSTNFHFLSCKTNLIIYSLQINLEIKQIVCSTQICTTERDILNSYSIMCLHLKFGLSLTMVSLQSIQEVYSCAAQWTAFFLKLERIKRSIPLKQEYKD